MQLLLFFRCTEQKYAQNFIESGNLRFGTPNEWINAARINNFGRGDSLEGSCIAISKQGITKVEPSQEFLVSEDKGFFFYQRKDVLALRTFCLFGLTELRIW